MSPLVVKIFDTVAFGEHGELKLTSLASLCKPWFSTMAATGEANIQPFEVSTCFCSSSAVSWNCITPAAMFNTTEFIKHIQESYGMRVLCSTYMYATALLCSTLPCSVLKCKQLHDLNVHERSPIRWVSWLQKHRPAKCHSLRCRDRCNHFLQRGWIIVWNFCFVPSSESHAQDLVLVHRSWLCLTPLLCTCCIEKILVVLQPCPRKKPTHKGWWQ